MQGGGLKHWRFDSRGFACGRGLRIIQELRMLTARRLAAHAQRLSRVQSTRGG